MCGVDAISQRPDAMMVESGMGGVRREEVDWDPLQRFKDEDARTVSMLVSSSVFLRSERTGRD